ncbi:hypothetical protein D9619_005263 [Psilocybe cf. subviscida]|uniref:RNA-dependent RNA polymerase n=1 Tax=Psilocybe cf. subviscida TaxID=2480587 RepID=A0A8H5FC06_9AGAR|nr:hypothetical protein D9619_005263 [Psilocybe cf. subviscida]
MNETESSDVSFDASQPEAFDIVEPIEPLSPGENKRKRSLNSTNDASPSSPKKVKVASEDYIVIAHSDVLASLMDGLNLANGVRYELARMITAREISYAEITRERLASLIGLNKDAVPRIVDVLKPGFKREDAHSHLYAEEQAANSPWAELDLEEGALAVGQDEGLGNNPRLPGWYGGKAEFRGRLVETKDQTSRYKIVLEPCTLGPSSRFARQFGSFSFLRVKIPLALFHNPEAKLNEWFNQSFVIWGRVYRACYAKGDNVFLYWTNEALEGGLPVRGRLSFVDFVFWHNPLRANANQLMTKWSARMALGFSNSVPGPLLRKENIIEIPDIVSDEKSEMTDGCGLSTKIIHRSILNQLGLHDIPTAMQFRLAGCKGMLSIRDDETGNSDEMKVWVRNSQIKIAYPKGMPLGKAQLTIDLLRTSRLSTPSRISSEIIINLAENGVKTSVFVDLLKASINETVQGLTTWEGHDTMFNLWCAVERTGGVLAGRRAREAVGEARVRGFRNRSADEEDLDEDEGDEEGDGPLGMMNNSPAQRSVAWWADQVSGCPSTLEDTVMVLLDSGFTPQTSPILREKLKQVVIKTIQNRMRRLRFELPQSCTAFAVPDPFGVLEEEQIFIKSSKRNLKTADGLSTDMVLGEVLVGRTPCKLPSDVRKVTAVDHPYLRNYVDVIVFSVKGKRRLIDFLAGGDYDGDKVLAMWDPEIVSHFQNAPDKFSVEPQGLDLSFTRDTESGDAFLERFSALSEAEKTPALQRYLLGGLVSPFLIGKYSTWHSNAIYSLGYAHPRTRKLASKFGRVMDAGKSGYRIKPETYAADRKEYNHPKGPRWMSKAAKKANSDEKDKPKFDASNMGFLKRDTKSPFIKGLFIMDKLHAAAEKEMSRLLGEMKTIFSPLLHTPDAHLLAPWKEAVDWAENRPGDSVEFRRMKKKDLGRIAAHVHDMYRKHKALMRSKNGFTDLPIEKRQDALRELSRELHSKPDILELPTISDRATLARLRASYAYMYDAEQNLKTEVDADGVEKSVVQEWTRFPWNLAMRELCTIKAAALGPYKVVIHAFYDRFKLIKGL